MIIVESVLTGKELDYTEVKERLEGYRFTLGGNWNYEEGCFDRSLDEEKQTVWLRIPFRVVHGRLDADASQPGTRIRIGSPFVLHHAYRTGNDPTADFLIAGGLVNQFQTPQDADADVKQAHVTEAKLILEEIGKQFS